MRCSDGLSKKDKTTDLGVFKVKESSYIIIILLLYYTISVNTRSLAGLF